MLSSSPFFRLVYLVGMIVLNTSSLAAEFNVVNGSTKIIENQVFVDAQIHYQFSDVAKEALENGVPITIIVYLQMKADNSWFWQPYLVKTTLNYQLRYRPLTESYQVWDRTTNEKETFETFEAAKEQLGNIRNILLIEQSQMVKGTKYKIEIKAALDIEALPLPLRPLAYVSSSWKLSSQWYHWILAF